MSRILRHSYKLSKLYVFHLSLRVAAEGLCAVQRANSGEIRIMARDAGIIKGDVLVYSAAPRCQFFAFREKLCDFPQFSAAKDIFSSKHSLAGGICSVA